MRRQAGGSLPGVQPTLVHFHYPKGRSQEWPFLYLCPTKDGPLYTLLPYQGRSFVYLLIYRKGVVIYLRLFLVFVSESGRGCRPDGLLGLLELRSRRHLS